MSVRTWHVGKLAIFWILSVIGALLCLALREPLEDRAQSERARRATWDANEGVLRQLSDSARISRDSLRRVLAFALAKNQEMVAQLPAPAPAPAWPSMPSLAPRAPRDDSLAGVRLSAEHEGQLLQQLIAHAPAPPNLTDVYLRWLLDSAAVLLAAAPFAVSWRWFGAREVRSKEPPS